MLKNDAQNTLSKFDFISHIGDNCYSKPWRF